MVKKKPALLLLIALVLTLAFSNLAFALDLEPSTQETTKQSDEEIKLGLEKVKYVKAFMKAQDDLHNKKLTKEEYDAVVDSLNSKNALQSSVTNSSVSASSLTYTSGALYIPAYGQNTTYYCGPASAYNLLAGIGITKNANDGRSLTQDHLAADLGTTSSGTSWPSKWASTMTTWANKSPFYYIASWASDSGSLSTWKNNLYLYAKYDVWNNSTGSIYNTHQKVSDTVNRLPGYESMSQDVWHYVAGDGYDETNPSARLVHYSDSNKYRSGAWGSHWVSVQIMGNITWDRGMVW